MKRANVIAGLICFISLIAFFGCANVLNNMFDFKYYTSSGTSQNDKTPDDVISDGGIMGGGATSDDDTGNTGNGNSGSGNSGAGNTGNGNSGTGNTGSGTSGSGKVDGYYALYAGEDDYYSIWEDFIDKYNYSSEYKIEEWYYTYLELDYMKVYTWFTYLNLWGADHGGKRQYWSQTQIKDYLQERLPVLASSDEDAAMIAEDIYNNDNDNVIYVIRISENYAYYVLKYKS